MKKSKAEHLGNKIKKIRAFNGMTQEELASAINKTRSMVSHIERTGEVNYHTLKEISKVLQLPLDQLQDMHSRELVSLNESPIETTAYASQQELIHQLKEEISFLKGTIQNQWKLLFELAK
ncbi:MAG: helix-turn-helix transcriptional regulator [Chitinophagales bacterium]